MAKRRAFTSWLTLASVLLLAAAVISGQQAPSLTDLSPRFQVASVRRSTSPGGSRANYQGETFTYTNGALRDIIRFAFGIGYGMDRPLADIANAPTWFDERYDIIAKTSGPVAPLTTRLGPVQAMLRTLLVDRFKLVAHWESRERPGYALRRVSETALGPNIRETESIDCAAYTTAMREARRAGTPPPPEPRRISDRIPVCGGSTLGAAGHIEMLLGNQSMKSFADILAGHLREPVTDETGFSGLYDVELDFWADTSGTAVRADLSKESALDGGPRGPSRTEALRDQLGLRLDRAPATIDVLVIDSVQRPSDN